MNDETLEKAKQNRHRREMLSELRIDFDFDEIPRYNLRMIDIEIKTDWKTKDRDLRYHYENDDIKFDCLKEAFKDMIVWIDKQIKELDKEFDEL
jgi:hypothetical protein